ncbi:MAG TPA: hypothetical protein VKV28_03770 [Candidatus Binataceae bacterium]|nr:hypothetical protein [Candidatus Binataceae bacterium]
MKHTSGVRRYVGGFGTALIACALTLLPMPVAAAPQEFQVAGLIAMASELLPGAAQYQAPLRGVPPSSIALASPHRPWQEAPMRSWIADAGGCARCQDWAGNIVIAEPASALAIERAPPTN